MDNDHLISDGVESEEISDPFLCCICLDLLFKPIVLSCGHISCFWCVHKSMSGQRESHCPLCRNPYYYFPTVCQLLHIVLLKLYPVAYKRRELQILEEEKIHECFSPQLNAQACSSQANQDSNILGNSACEESCANMNKIEPISHIQNGGTTISKQTHGGDYEGIENVTKEEKNFLLNQNRQISVADVLCAACKQLLFRPVVLNCGHVYCESCIINPDEQMLRCQVCSSSHPSGFPKVCLELGHFLDKQFPKEYALRRDAVQLKEADIKHVNPTACETQASKQGEKLPWWSDPHSQFHTGVGCDYCGMYPIIGDRYRCMDCVEIIGFDLCSDCYNTSSKLPGRFNQQHTPEHRFQLVQFNILRNKLKVVTRRLDDGSIGLVIANITAETSEEEILSSALYIEAQEVAENLSAAANAAISTNSGDEQDDSQPSVTEI